jgi:hypothetical protein
MATPTELVVQAAKGAAIEERVRREAALAIVNGGASSALERLPERAALELSYDEVREAADAGDTDTALKLFRRALLRQRELQAAVSVETERQIEQAKGLKLLDPALLRELEAAAEQAEAPAPPQLPRHVRREQIRAERKRLTKPKPRG